MDFINDKETVTMAYPKDLPDPKKEYPDFLIDLMKCKEPTTLGQYREAGGAEGRLHWICAGEHLNNAAMAEIVDVLVPTDETKDKVHYYMPSEAARSFWETALADGKTPTEIVDGWNALMSITREGATDDPTAG